MNPGVGSSVVPWRYGKPAMREVAILTLEGGPVSAPDLKLLDPALVQHKRAHWEDRA